MSDHEGSDPSPAADLTTRGCCLVEFRLLGPVEAWDDGRRLELGPRQQRFVLALLLLEAGRVVQVERLVDLLWPGSPPRSARHAIQVRVSRLRGLLGATAPLVWDGAGYRIEVDPVRVDVHRFRTLVARARTHAESERDEESVALFAEARALWTGPPLSGTVPEELRGQLCHGLEEARLSAVEDQFEAELRLGRHTSVVDGLEDLVRTHPTRERLVAGLMLALHRSGQTARALEVARSARTHLADELGIDPGAELQHLELAILRDDPELAAPVRRPPARSAPSGPLVPPTPPTPPGPPTPTAASTPTSHATIPAQLPPAVPGFVGRAADLALLDEQLGAGRDGRSPGPLVLSGMGGVGKTSLALHWAHGLTHRFPDGQLYLDLRGHAELPAIRPVVALAHFLRGLGMDPAAIPTDLDSAAAAYRSALAGKALLVVLDNAGTAEQVRPLLPASPRCRTIVTSRDRLSGLVTRDGAVRLPLDTLPSDEAIDLLEGLLGPARAAQEATAVAWLAERCAHLPLALRIAAGYLTDHPHQSISSYVDELRTGDLLGALTVDGDDTAVRTTFDLSYQRLGEPERRVFRLLGLVPGPDFTVEVAAALGAIPPAEAHRHLTRLTGSHLLSEHAPGRFTLHDLLRHYAAQRAATDESASGRADAVERLRGWHYGMSHAAAIRLRPSNAHLPAPPLPDDVPVVDCPDDRAARNWYATERENLLSLVVDASDHGPHHWSWLLAELLRPDLSIRGLRLEGITNATAALRAAAACVDPLVLASVHLGYANAMNLGHPDQQVALTHYQTALGHAEEAGAVARAGAIRNNLGLIHLRAGHFPGARTFLQRSLEDKLAAGPAGSEAGTLANLAVVMGCAGELRGGHAHLRRALDLLGRTAGNPHACFVLVQLGAFCRSLGRPLESLAHLDRASETARESGNNRMRIDASVERAETYAEVGRIDEAMTEIQRAARDSDESGDHLVIAGSRLVSGTLALRLGEIALAAREHHHALEVARAAPNRILQISAHRGIAKSHAAASRPTDASRHIRTALSLATDSGAVTEKGHVLTVRADIERALGNTGEAVRAAEEALAIHCQTEHHLGRARAITALAQARRAHRPDESGDTDALLHEAYGLFSSFGSPDAEQIHSLLSASPRR